MTLRLRYPPGGPGPTPEAARVLSGRHIGVSDSGGGSCSFGPPAAPSQPPISLAEWHVPSTTVLISMKQCMALLLDLHNPEVLAAAGAADLATVEQKLGGRSFAHPVQPEPEAAQARSGCCACRNP